MEPTPGIQTTEFWTSLLTILLTSGISVASLIGLHFNQDHLLALIPTLASLAAAVTAAFYSHSRAKVKVAAHTAAPAVVNHGVTNVNTEVNGGLV